MNYEVSKDLEAFCDFSGMSKSELSQQVGLPRSTFNNWKIGKANPTRSSLEVIYSFLYKSGYRINTLKEQMFKDSTSKNSVILFHGAKEDLKGDVSLEYSSLENDFGRGFYLGESLLQSASFVCNYPTSSVYIAKLKLDKKLNILEFEVDTTWMLTIAYFRGRLEQYKDSNILNDLSATVQNADIIRAPIADNRMFQILDEFIEGNITDLQCKSALSATDLGKQYVAVSEKGLKNLELIHHCYLCSDEKTDYLKEKEEFNRVSAHKVKFVKREFAGKGKYIEEVLS